MLSAPSTDDRTFLFVTTGTDQFPFTRVVRWIDEWLDGRRLDVRCLIQGGLSDRPANAPSEAYLPFDRFVAELERADVVVSHAGTGCIMLCRRFGRIPIVVPRRRRFGEAVDDHQVAFAKRMVGQGDIVLAESRDALVAALDTAVADPGSVRRTPQPEALAESVRRFEELVDPLMNGGGDDFEDDVRASPPNEGEAR
jgi:UDP-N-acetylglucosamine transferase subunit ALG13